jgi:hypothetical protein
MNQLAVCARPTKVNLTMPSRSFLCLGSSVRDNLADSTNEGSPGRDRASSLARNWMCRYGWQPPFGCCLVLISGPSGRLNFVDDRPNETRQLARNRRGDHGRQFSGPGELAIPVTKSFLSFPGDITDRLRQAHLSEKLLAADPGRKPILQAASINIRLATPFPALVMPPCRRVPRFSDRRERGRVVAGNLCGKFGSIFN